MNEQERKRESVQKGIASVMNVKKELEKICATLTNDFESLMEKAEKLGGSIAYVFEANGLKCKKSEKIEESKKSWKKHWNFKNINVAIQFNNIVRTKYIFVENNKYYFRTIYSDLLSTVHLQSKEDGLWKVGPNI